MVTVLSQRLVALVNDFARCRVYDPLRIPRGLPLTVDDSAEFHPTTRVAMQVITSLDLDNGLLHPGPLTLHLRHLVHGAGIRVGKLQSHRGRPTRSTRGSLIRLRCDQRASLAGMRRQNVSAGTTPHTRHASLAHGIKNRCG